MIYLYIETPNIGAASVSSSTLVMWTLTQRIETLAIVWCVFVVMNYNLVQSQNAVTAYSSSKQLLPFGFADLFFPPGAFTKREQ